MVVWPNHDGYGHINKVTTHQARLVQGCVIIRRYNIMVCNQPPRPTQPSTLSGMGMSTSQSAVMLYGCVKAGLTGSTG